MAGAGDRCGVIVPARGDPRLARASLAAIVASRTPPDRVVLAVPKGREHAFARVVGVAARAEIVAAAETDLVAAALAALARDTDLVVVVGEGVVLDPDYLDALRDETARFEDIVAGLDLVGRVLKITTEGDAVAADLALADHPDEPALVSRLRALVRARSLMGAVFFARVAPLRQIRIATAGEGGDVVAFALALDQLRMRGRTSLRFTPRARHLRLLPERRTGFDVGYGLYRRIGQLGEAQRNARAVGGPPVVHLDPRLERFRLVAEQALRSLLSGAGRHNASTFLKGVLAARRDAVAVRRTLVRDLRELR